MIPNRKSNPRLPAAGLAALFSLLLAACAGQAAAPAEYAPAVASSINDKPIVVIDESGNPLGKGTVSLYAPTSMRLDQAAKIRLEIVGTGIIANVVPPTLVETQGPTPSAKQELEIHEIMGATLQGADTFHFTINTVPDNGLRNIDVKSTTWWEWNLRPVGAGSVGDNSLELFVYYPRSTDSGVALNQEIATFPITLTVSAPPTPEPNIFDRIDASIGPVARVAGAITAIAGAIAAIYGAYRFFTRRRKPSRSRRHQ